MMRRDRGALELNNHFALGAHVGWIQQGVQADVGDVGWVCDASRGPARCVSLERPEER